MSGPAFELDASTGTVLSNDFYDLWIDTRDGSAADPRSGARSIEIRVDGVVKDRVEEPCATESCGLDHEWELAPYDYAEGKHRIEVIATDMIGNVSSRSWEVMLAREDEPADTEVQAEQTEEQGRQAAASETFSGTPDPLGVTVLGIGSPGCRAYQPEIDSKRRDITLILSKDRETTVFFADQAYRVSRCRADGTLDVSMLVGLIAVPGGGTARVPRDEYRRVTADRIQGLIPEYGTPDQPKWAALWLAEGAAATARVIPPTSLP